MPQSAALYLVETVVPDDPAEFDAATMMRDLNMLVLVPARSAQRRVSCGCSPRPAWS
jgi:hypothetical protein